MPAGCRASTCRRHRHRVGFPLDASSSVRSAPIWSFSRWRKPMRTPSGTSPGRSFDVQQFETSRAADFLVRQVASGNGGVPDLEGPATRADAYRVQDALVEKL